MMKLLTSLCSAKDKSIMKLFSLFSYPVEMKLYDETFSPFSYRVKIQTVNTYGRSLWSQPFEFDTFGGSYFPV